MSESGKVMRVMIRVTTVTETHPPSVSLKFTADRSDLLFEPLHSDCRVRLAAWTKILGLCFLSCYSFVESAQELAFNSDIGKIMSACP